MRFWDYETGESVNVDTSPPYVYVTYLNKDGYEDKKRSYELREVSITFHLVTMCITGYCYQGDHLFYLRSFELTTHPKRKKK